jgi:MFS family permease
MSRATTRSTNSNETDLIAENRLVRAMHSLRDPTYRWWFACQIFSSSGSMTQGVAQSWLVLQLTGSPLYIALIGGLTFAPTLVGGAWAGTLVDRVDVRRLLIVTNAVFVALCVAQTALVATGGIRLWMLFVFSAVNGLVMAADGPARQVYVFQLVGRERLASAIGLFEVIINASRAIGPGTGGLLLATLGTATCFLFNALSYLPTLWVLLHFRPRTDVVPARSRQPIRIRDGLVAVRRNPQIRSTILVAAAAGMLFNLGTTTSLFATRVLHLGGGGFGALMACFGLGALPGAFMAASAAGEPTGRKVRVLTLCTAVAVLATASTPVPAGAFVGIAVTGFLSIWLVATGNTLVQLRSSPQLRGRVMGIWSMALPGSSPVTGIFSALAAQLWPRAGFGLAGVALLIVGAVTWAALGRREGGTAPALRT